MKGFPDHFRFFGAMIVKGSKKCTHIYVLSHIKIKGLYNSYALLEEASIPDPLVPIGDMSHISCRVRPEYFQATGDSAPLPPADSYSPTLHMIRLVLLLNLAKPTCS